MLAALITAPSATAGDHDTIGAMVRAARDAGAEVVVVAAPRETAIPAGARHAVVPPGAAAITAIRTGLALLANTPSRFVLRWPLGAATSHDGNRLRALVGAASEAREGVIAFAGDDLDAAPVLVARDAWLELMTLGEAGIGAVVARRGVRWVDT